MTKNMKIGSKRLVDGIFFYQIKSLIFYPFLIIVMFIAGGNSLEIFKLPSYVYLLTIALFLLTRTFVKNRVIYQIQIDYNRQEIKLLYSWFLFIYDEAIIKFKDLQVKIEKPPFSYSFSGEQFEIIEFFNQSKKIGQIVNEDNFGWNKKEYELLKKKMKKLIK